MRALASQPAADGHQRGQCDRQPDWAPRPTGTPPPRNSRLSASAENPEASRLPIKPATPPRIRNSTEKMRGHPRPRGAHGLQNGHLPDPAEPRAGHARGQNDRARQNGERRTRSASPAPPGPRRPGRSPAHRRRSPRSPSDSARRAPSGAGHGLRARRARRRSRSSGSLSSTPGLKMYSMLEPGRMASVRCSAGHARLHRAAGQVELQRAPRLHAQPPGGLLGHRNQRLGRGAELLHH